MKRVKSDMTYVQPAPQLNQSTEYELSQLMPVNHNSMHGTQNGGLANGGAGTIHGTNLSQHLMNHNPQGFNNASTASTDNNNYGINNEYNSNFPNYTNMNNNNNTNFANTNNYYSWNNPHTNNIGQG